MKYFETDLQESYDWPNRYYAVRVLKGRDKVIDSFYIIGADAAISNVPYLTRLTTIYTDVALTDVMSMLFVRNPYYDAEERVDSVLALPYEELDKYGVEAVDFDDLVNGISLVPDNNSSFYYADTYQYKLYRIFQGNEELVETVLSAKDGNWLEAEKDAMDNLDRLMVLPKAKDLPEPLKSLVYDQYYCESGMLFIENDEEFRKKWSADDLKKLSAQIDEFGIRDYIDMPARPEDAFEIPEGEPVITVYCGLSGRFNFI